MTEPSLTPFAAFRARAPFRFRQPNSVVEQRGSGGTVYLTSSQQFLGSVVLRHKEQFELLGPRATIACAPRDTWPNLDLAGKRVGLVLPSQALGGNVATLLAVEALLEQRAPRSVAVFCARSATDIFRLARSPRKLDLFPLWIAEADLAGLDHVLDLGRIEARRDIEIWPVDMEAEILGALGLGPSTAFPAEARPLPARKRLRIGIFPLASSPMRTLPVAVTQALAATLAAEGEVTVFLNHQQGQGRLYAEALAAAPPKGAAVHRGFDTIGGLLDAMRRLDYAVFADSGPAHMAKLFALPGVAVYTSAPADVLQGRFRNLTPWTVPFAGPHCTAPCGLAKIRATADGRSGCMGSLGVALEALPEVHRAADPEAVERLLLREPVPCVAALGRDHPDTLAAFIRADLGRRRAA